MAAVQITCRVRAVKSNILCLRPEQSGRSGGLLMHEFAVTKQLVKCVQQYADENEAEKVTDVYLKIGDLRGMVNDWVVRYFAYASKGTNIEGAKVHIETIPGRLVCQCGALTPLERGNMDAVCCACGGRNLRIINGTEFMLAGIGVVTRNEEDAHV